MEDVPQYGGVEEWRVNETAVRPEGPGGSQDMQVGMPVQKLPGGLDGDDGGGKSVAPGIFTEERGKSLPGAQGEFGEKPSLIPECRPQDLGECEDEMPVRNGADHPLPDEFHPQSGAFGAAGRAEPSLFAGEGDEIFVFADVAPDAREAALGKAAPEKALDGLRDDPSQRSEGPLKPLFVFPGEPVEELEKNGVEGGPLGAPGTIELRVITLFRAFTVSAALMSATMRT